MTIVVWCFVSAYIYIYILQRNPSKAEVWCPSGEDYSNIAQRLYPHTQEHAVGYTLCKCAVAAEEPGV